MSDLVEQINLLQIKAMALKKEVSFKKSFSLLNRGNTLKH